MKTLLELLPDQFTYRDALDTGLTKRQLAAARDEGLVTCTGRGRYQQGQAAVDVGERWEMTRSDQLRRARKELLTHPGTAASHSTAAMVHDLPLLMAPSAPTEIVRIEDYPSSRRVGDLIIHHADSTATETVVVDEIRTTPVARTIADCLRSRKLPHGVALLDQSIRTGRTTIEAVEHELGRQRRWKGRPRALDALAIADPRRESYGESHSYGVMHLGGYPLPIPQVEVYDESFTFVARLDGLLDHELVATEMHGKEKFFLDPVSPDQEESVRLKLEAEARRKQRIERLGLVVAEWNVGEAMSDHDVVYAALNRAMAKARQATFTGWVRWEGRFSKLPLLPRTD